MKLMMVIEVDNELLKRCISAAWQRRFGSDSIQNEIKDFSIGDKLIPTDMQNILIGSSLGELVNNTDKVTMEIIE